MISYNSSLVIDSLCDQAEGKDIAVVGLYCDFLAQEEQSTANMLGAMVKQLANRGGIPKHTREAFQKAKKEFGGRGLRLLDMIDILKKAITSLPRLFICIDGLDECTTKHRRDLMESLQEIVRVSPGPRVFLTGRQCSQSSGAPVGPGGGTAKTHGRDGTAKCSPSSSLNPQDGRHWQGRQAPRSETTWDRGRSGTAGDGRGRQGTVGDGRGRSGTAGDGGGRQGTVEDGR